MLCVVCLLTPPPQGKSRDIRATVLLLVPDPEHEARKTRVEEGIPMTDTLVKEVRQVAEEAGAPFILGN